MTHEIIKKPWSWETCVYETPDAAIWLLHIARGKKTSCHCHPNKRTRLIALSEGIQFTDDSGSRLLKPLEVVDIPKGVFHQSEAINLSSIVPSSENGVWLLEIEEPNNKSDILRKEDAYGRQDQPIESNGVQYNGDILTLSNTPKHFMGYKIHIENNGHGYHPLFHPFGKNKEFRLVIEKDNTVKLSDYVADFIADLGIKHVFSVSGGGSMHLVDSIGKHERLEYVATHHEQAAAMAADAYSRINGIGAALFTTGPGGTNSITGVACSWVDSIPVLYISGQVTRDTLIGQTGLRQFGVQESNIVELVTPITKYAVCVTDENMIRYYLEKALWFAKCARPGPVWIDIPLDIQSKRIDPSVLKSFVSPCAPPVRSLDPQGCFEKCVELLKESIRPVMIVGNGVRLSGAEKEILYLINKLQIPVITSWSASDMVADNEFHIGHCGIFGDRASNFSVQNSDLLLVIGCRLSVPQIGYNFSQFARGAKIIMVDMDDNELNKPSLNIHHKIPADAKYFIEQLILFSDNGYEHEDWVEKCIEWKNKYQVCLPEYKDQKEYVNSYYFIEQLSSFLSNDAIVVTDMGTAFTCTFQTAKMKLGQEWVTASGHAPMGYGLPGAIGACFASGKKQTICIVGDGSLQMNLQELATIRQHNLPITIFVINNGGYLAIRHTQANHFGKFVGEGTNSGLWFPNVWDIAKAYFMQYTICVNHSDLNMLFTLGGLYAVSGPLIVEIMMNQNQPLIPKVSSRKLPDGSIKSQPIENMYPFLPDEAFKSNMIVPTVEVYE